MVIDVLDEFVVAHGYKLVLIFILYFSRLDLPRLILELILRLVIRNLFLARVDGFDLVLGAHKLFGGSFLRDSSDV